MIGFIGKILRNLYEHYKFTLFFCLMILLVSIPYNLLVPPEYYCTNSGFVSMYMYLTSPFNIGCETNLMNMDTESGKVLFLANFTFPLIFTIIVETALYLETERYRRNVFFAAFLASYALQVITVVFMQMKSVGTSVVGVSMLVFLVYWFGRKAWFNRKNLLKFLLSCVLALSCAWVSYTAYSGDNLFGHVVGAGFFLLLLACVLIDPMWDEHLKMRLTKIWRENVR